MPAIEISKIGTESLLVPVIGVSPLLMHNFSAKERQKMLDGMQGNNAPKEPKNPQLEYEAAFHRMKEDHRYGFPAGGFKKATVSATRFFGVKVTATLIRQSVFFKGEISDNDPQALIEIIGEPRMREDVVKHQGSSNLRYRPEWPEWSAVLPVTYVKSSLTRNALITLIDAGGMGCGIGEWRVEKGGDFGMYTVDTSKEVQVVG